MAGYNYPLMNVPFQTYRRNTFNDVNHQSTLYINDIPVTFNSHNDESVLMGFEINVVKSMRDRNVGKVKEIMEQWEYYSLKSFVSVMFDRAVAFSKEKDEKNLFEAYHDFSDRTRLLDEINNVYEMIILRPVISADEKQVGFMIAYFMNDFKLRIRNENNAFYRNKLTLNSFAPIVPFSDHYVSQGIHISDDHIYQDSKNGFIGLLKDLLMRLMTMADMPINTECTKENRYSIQTTPSILVSSDDPYQEELA
jgi:hypothetical protein